MISKFKVGDKVKWIGEPTCGTYKDNIDSGAEHMVITYEDDDYYWYDVCNRAGNKLSSCSGCGTHDKDGKIELYNEGEKKMARRTFRQLKDTIDSKKGCVWQEACDDSDQEYVVITQDLIKGADMTINYVDRALVEEQPEWFVEVFQVEPQYMTTAELEQWEAFKKAPRYTGTLKGEGKLAINRKGTWTPERRAAQSARMKKRIAAKKRAATRAANLATANQQAV